MQIDTQRYERLTTFKANFDQIYTAPDPREYYRILYGLDYIIPELAKPVFRDIIDKRVNGSGKRLKVLDLGASYGINAGLIRFPLSLARLARRYVSPEMFDLSPAQVVGLDRNYFAAWPRRSDAVIIGQDTSAPAIDYATNVGLIDGGITTNLEVEAPNERESAFLSNLDVIVSTGCVGYITGLTFRRVLDLQEDGHMPWLVNFVLRMYPFDAVAAELGRYGLVTEKVPGMTFVQRRFHSKDEFESTVDALRGQGVDPTGKESEGLLHAELYVSRPQEDVDALPLSELFSVTSGAQRNYGRRFVEIAGQPPMLVH